MGNGNGLLTWVRGVGILLLAGFIGWSALTTQSNAVALGRVIEKRLEREAEVPFFSQKIRQGDGFGHRSIPFGL